MASHPLQSVDAHARHATLKDFVTHPAWFVVRAELEVLIEDMRTNVVSAARNTKNTAEEIRSVAGQYDGAQRIMQYFDKVEEDAKSANP
jgi:hypothetical protein